MSSNTYDEDMICGSPYDNTRRSNMADEKKPIIKFAPNLPAKDLLFGYDTGYEIAAHEGTKKDGTKFQSKVQYLHTVTHNGIISSAYFDKFFNDKVVALSPKGKVLRIGKVQNEGDKYAKWTLEVVGDAPKAVVPVATPVAQPVAPTPTQVVTQPTTVVDDI